VNLIEERNFKFWKGFLNVNERAFFTKFRKRNWYKLLLGEELVLIPFEPDYIPFRMDVLEDEEWEYMGEVVTVWTESQKKVKLVIFRRR